MMGVEFDDCRKVARMIGVKTFLNEFIAYRYLGDLIINKAALETHLMSGGNHTWIGDDIMLHARPGFNETLLEDGIISVSIMWAYLKMFIIYNQSQLFYY